MNRKKFLFIAIALGVVVAGFFMFKHFGGEEQTTEVFIRKRGGPCPGETKIFTMQEPYMRGILEQGQKFKVIMNYYDCNPAKRGDLVFYQMHASMDPIVKIVRGAAGDKFTLYKDKKNGGWNLEVNGDKIYSATEKETPYHFGVHSTPPPLVLYERSHKGKIGPGDVLILSSFPPGDKDSGLFGMFSLSDVVGKVELIEGQEPTKVEEPLKAKPTPAPVVKPVAKTPAKQKPKTSPKK